MPVGVDAEERVVEAGGDGGVHAERVREPDDSTSSLSRPPCRCTAHPPVAKQLSFDG
jgi:hypothetical protein